MSDPSASATEKVTGMEALRSLPVEQRIIAMLQTLERLKQSNFQLAHAPTLTKEQVLKAERHKGAVKAYHDTSIFLTSLFETELQEALQAVAVDQAKETAGNSGIIL